MSLGESGYVCLQPTSRDVMLSKSGKTRIPGHRQPGVLLPGIFVIPGAFSANMNQVVLFAWLISAVVTWSSYDPAMSIRAAKQLAKANISM